MLVAHGVNRLSMGAQSFDASELAALERHHDPEDVPRGIEIARSAGLRRLNVDLIYAIPPDTAKLDALTRVGHPIKYEHISVTV